MWQEADAIPAIESAWTYDHLYLFDESVNSRNSAIRIPSMKDRIHDAARRVLRRQQSDFGPCLDGWTALSALLQATTRLRGGCMVTGMMYRHPAVLAKMAVTADIISDGRLELGVGTGWSRREAAAYGLQMGSWTERYDRFEEGLEVITRMLSTAATTYRGDYFELTAAPCEPKPLQRSVPMLIGGAHEKRMLPLVAKYASTWHAGYDLGVVREKRRILDEHCDAVGRTTTDITTAMPAHWNGTRLGTLKFRATLENLQAAGVDLAIVTVGGNDPRLVAKLEKLLV